MVNKCGPNVVRSWLVCIAVVAAFLMLLFKLFTLVNISVTFAANEISLPNRRYTGGNPVVGSWKPGKRVKPAVGTYLTPQRIDDSQWLTT